MVLLVADITDIKTSSVALPYSILCISGNGIGAIQFHLGYFQCKYNVLKKSYTKMV